MRSSNPYTTSLFCVLADARETRRVDTYLSALFPEKSRSYIQGMITKGQILCNEKNFTKNKKVYRGDIIEVRWQVEKMWIVAENIEIDIIFENDDFAIINKDAGMNTHPTPWENGRRGTLVNALLHHFDSLWIRTDDGISRHPSIINGIERPWIVHRLDKDTSGLIMIAKNDRAMHALQLKMEKRTIKKQYLALVYWKIKDESGYIESYIGRDPHDRKKMTTMHPVNPKLSKTFFCNKGYIHNKYTLLDVELLTGRTHQIRVHLASIGYPIVGDKIYANNAINTEAYQQFWLDRQWLHAHKLEFQLFGKNYIFNAPLKKDIKKVL